MINKIFNKNLTIVAIAAVSVTAALSAYKQVNLLSRDLAGLKKELVEQYQNEYQNLDLKIETAENGLLNLKKEGYVEADDFSKISQRIFDSTVLVASEQEVGKINFSGDILTVEDSSLSGAGTGFFVRKDGYIVTARHVVDAIGGDIMIFIPNGKKYKARVVGGDDKSDLAILKVEGDNFPAVQLGYFDNIISGDYVGFIGFSLSTGVVKPLIYRGNISGKGFDGTGAKIFSINAFVNRGNSGGPFFQLKPVELSAC